jgi:hypothetical protein
MISRFSKWMFYVKLNAYILNDLRFGKFSNEGN